MNRQIYSQVFRATFYNNEPSRAAVVACTLRPSGEKVGSIIRKPTLKTSLVFLRRSWAHEGMGNK